MEMPALLTGSDEIAQRVRALRNYGSEVKYHHPETGFNSRLDTLQAVVLSAKLARLAEWNAARRRAAQRYDELLASIPGVRLPSTLAGNQHVWHLYVVRVPRRDAVLTRLSESGIGAGIHYPVPIHLQGAYRQRGHRVGDFPVAERAAGEILSLPIFAEITPAQQERTAAALKQALA
jgi:dTDP-4-amino-4,6-dideoxygalactose transaminase